MSPPDPTPRSAPTTTKVVEVERGAQVLAPVQKLQERAQAAQPTRLNPPANIFLLGPDEWDDHISKNLAAPVWVENDLGRSSKPYTPQELRRALAARISKDSGGMRNGIIMEEGQRRDDEDPASHFHRIETETGIDAYFFIVPKDAKIVGTVFEVGMLTRDWLIGQAPKVVIFFEEGFATESEDGDVTFSKGKRTRFYDSVLEFAHVPTFWRTPEELADLVVRQSRQY